MRLSRILVCGALALAIAAPSPVENIKAKFHGLALGIYPPGSRVVMRMQDLNPYLESILPYNIPNGLRNIDVETDNDNIVRGTADIDFLKVRQAQGVKSNWLLSQLAGGRTSGGDYGAVDFGPRQSEGGRIKSGDFRDHSGRPDVGFSDY